MHAPRSANVLLAALSLAVMGCSSVQVNLRTDVDTTNSKIVVLPALLYDGKVIAPANATYANPGTDEMLAREWSMKVGAENTVAVSKAVLDATPGAYNGINELIVGIHPGASMKPVGRDSDFLKFVATKIVDGAVAFALVDQNESAYKATRHVRLVLGLFDAKRLAWKWTATNEYGPGLFGFLTDTLPYQTVVDRLVAESFAQVKSQNGGAVR